MTESLSIIWSIAWRTILWLGLSGLAMGGILGAVLGALIMQLPGSMIGLIFGAQLGGRIGFVVGLLAGVVLGLIAHFVLVPPVTSQRYRLATGCLGVVLCMAGTWVALEFSWPIGDRFLSWDRLIPVALAGLSGWWTGYQVPAWYANATSKVRETRTNPRMG